MHLKPHRVIRLPVLFRATALGTLGLLLFASWLQAESPPSVCPPQIQWQLGLGDKSYQRFHRVVNRPEGGYLVGGQYYGRDDGVWLVALRADGSTAWERFYSASGSHYLNDLQPVAGGGYIIAGTAWIPAGGERSYKAELIRLDSNGDVVWTRTYGGSDLNLFQTVRQTKDGGFIAAGSSWSPTGPDKTSPLYGRGDAWIVKVDGDGNKIWERSYGGTGLDEAGSILQMVDGGYLVSGASDSPADGNKSLPGFGGFDGWILRLDDSGQKMWERVFGTTNHDGLVLIGELPDGAFLLSGYASSPPGGNKTSPSFGGSDAWVVSIDANGNKVWEKTFGGTDSDGLYAGRKMADGGYILAGYSQSPVSGNKTSPKVGGNDMWLVRVDSSGNKLWERSIGGGNPYGSSIFDVALTPDGGFIAVGETFNDIGGDKTVPWLGSGDGWIVKLGPETDCDSDHDGVPDNRDRCPNTPPGAAVDAQGCSIAQHCPCEGTKNHGEYVRCVNEQASQFSDAGLITAAQKQDFIRDAARSDCGKQHGMRLHIRTQSSSNSSGHGREIIVSGDLTSGAVLETSVDLVHWTAVATNQSGAAEFRIPDGGRNNSAFYRLRQR